MKTPLFGFLNIDKPRGETSRWVDDRVKHLVQPNKVGHAGTLDPLASGVLIVAVGQATRLMEYLKPSIKHYRAEFLLGRTSETEDIQGEVTEIDGAPIPNSSQIDQAAARFVGTIQQRPPVFSALKIGGRRAYELARKGRTVELVPRPVTIHRLDVIEYDFPRLVLEIQCSSGTYVRSLGRDLAESLGTGAVMSALERTAVGSFHVGDSIGVTTLTRDNLPDHLLSPCKAVEHLSSIQLDDAELAIIRRGQFIPCPGASDATPIGQEFAAFNAQGNFAAVLHRRTDGMLGAVLNFAAHPAN